MQCMTAVTNYIHCAVLLRKATHNTASSEGAHKFVLSKTAIICTLFRGISIKYTLHICYILTLMSLTQKCLHVFFHWRFHQSMPHTIQFSVPSVALSHVFVAIKEKYYCPSFEYRESQSHSAPKQQWHCTVLTVGNSHTQKAVFGCVTSVTESQHLQSPYYQPVVLTVHSLTLTH
jgi:hypothetical protein